MAQKFSPDDIMIEIMKDVSFYTDKNNNEDVYIEFKTINGGGYFGRKDSQYFLSVLPCCRQVKSPPSIAG